MSTAWQRSHVRLVDDDEIRSHFTRVVPGFDARKHHSGLWGSAKTFLHHFLPNVTRCVYVEQDIAAVVRCE